MCSLPNMQAPELKELTPYQNEQKKKIKHDAIKAIAIDYQLLENTI